MKHRTAVEVEKKMFDGYCKIRDYTIKRLGVESVEATRIIGIAWHQYTMKRGRAGIVSMQQGWKYKDEVVK